ncbi:Ig-like domain-containing protein [Hyunsoonleella sp. 2307UL5-6]|uniref:Ig-like domain-containing protein n=1 Tax=Hyunsoonleella sp. 2307UL5-6 TaxID=3384768 RepID=UPI0039BD13D8
MNYLLIKTDYLIVLFIILFSLFSCNNEALYVIEENVLIEDEETIVEEEVSDTFDIVQAVNDTIRTSEDKTVDFKPYLNDINLPENISFTNSLPSNGSLSINDNSTPNDFTDDTLDYIPNIGFFGTDTFDYEICDANNEANCDSAIVTLIVDPDPVIEEDIAVELKAFPSAFGAASGAKGGRGGRVIHVTNLNDSGSGSFREAIQASGPRIIIFDVSGEIITQSDIRILNGDLTIAGQTAPVGGITLRGHRFVIEDSADDVIIRYLRFRQDRNNGGTNSTLVGTYSPSHVIFDHCSLAYGKDETMLIWDDTTKAGPHTISRCIFAEGKTAVILGSGVDEVRKHNADEYTFHHNLISHMHRTPNLAGNGQFEVVNNVIYNWQIRLSSIYNSAELNHINNYYKAAYATEVKPPNFSGYYFNKIGRGFDGKVYTQGNIYEGFNNLNTDNWGAWADFGTNLTSNQTFRANTPYQSLGEFILNPESANSAFNSVLNNVGANASLNADGTVTKWLDSNDALYISDALNGTDSFSVNQGNGVEPRWYATNPVVSLNFPEIPNNSRPTGYDDDRDGMPDEWELEVFKTLERDGLGDFDNDGYTDLEEFLNIVDKD